jgi:hypothetical protein
MTNINHTLLEKIYNEVSNSIDENINVVTATDAVARRFEIDREIAKILTEAQYGYPNDTVIVEVFSKPDDLGRQTFDIFRWAWNINFNKEQWCGQGFFANLTEHLRSIERDSKKVHLIIKY